MLLSKFLLFLFFSSMASSSSDDFTDFVYGGCSQPKYAPASPYKSNIETLFTSLANSAALSSYANFTSAAASGAPEAYGLFQCRGDLPVSNCAACVRSGLSQLSALCPSAAGAAVQLRGCLLRYGNDSFLGKPDTAVLYRKCSSSSAYGGGHGGGDPSLQLSMRDAALAALLESGGRSYRLGTAGEAKAVAQCVGDQSGKQCDECTAAALARLREACGRVAAAGDAYLGKCYVRYWSDGVDTSDDDDDDEIGKTVAIIIGLIAGVALVLVCLSFIRKARNKGKY
ncbi:plasmodesmata-located protein 6-like isoform X2 [Zingiber officinale]|uniref:plasmodesmata-located protein 6-like isoform X2 n=1 Tax=Zingiber officinale TaxID=94328 RepID=UPI001C4CAD95|nr:plasmodesmata-located protein 6-like isoform X2 [Zingiber officinale]